MKIYIKSKEEISQEISQNIGYEWICLRLYINNLYNTWQEVIDIDGYDDYDEYNRLKQKKMYLDRLIGKNDNKNK